VALIVVGALTVMAPKWFARDGSGGEGPAAQGLPAAGASRAADEGVIRIAVLPFEARGSGDDLATWGELVAEAITREVGRSQARDVVPYSTVRATRAGAMGATPAEMARALEATRLLTGTVTGLGADVRVDMEVTEADGNLVRALEPVTGPSGGIQDLIDDVAVRAAGAVLALTDSDWPTMARGTVPPSTEVYQDLAMAYDAFWCREDWSRSAELLNGILAEHPDHIPSLIQLLPTYWLLGQGGDHGREQRRAVAERLRPLVSRMTSFERAMHESHASSLAGDGVARLNAARQAFREFPPGAGYVMAQAAFSMSRFDLALVGLEAIDYENDCGWSLNWTLRADVHHLRGEYADELRWARDGLVRFPENETLLRHEAQALGALDSLEAVRSVVETLKRHPSETRGNTVGWLGSELIIHGHTALGAELLEEGFRLQAAESQSRHRHVSTRLYYMEDWEALLPIAEEIVADPEAGLADRASNLYYRVLALVRLGRTAEAEDAQAQLEEVLRPSAFLRIALPAARGDVRGVTNVLQEVLSLGGSLPAPGWYHLAPELQPIVNDPAFQVFIRQVTSGEGG
jgi:TolB-like protein